MSPQSSAEVFALPGSLPEGYTYVSAEPPTADTHATFAGAVAATRGAHTLRISIRWTARPDLTGAIDDSAAGAPLSEVAGRAVYFRDEGRFARIPMTEETNVWLLFDQVIGELSPGLFETLVESLNIVDEMEWRALVESLVESG